MSRPTLKELLTLPTLAEGQADNLKIDAPGRRVWLSRCGVADGEPYPNKVTIEVRQGGRWVVTDTYQAR